MFFTGIKRQDINKGASAIQSKHSLELEVSNFMDVKSTQGIAVKNSQKSKL